MSEAPAFVELPWCGARARIEHAWVGAAGRGAPVIVFLHEGLGSLAMWKDFPARLCHAVGCRGLVYSRPGYGQSTTAQADHRWSPDFMHRQAREFLPTLLGALDIDPATAWLFGHSDGGSIALLHAAMFPGQVAGVIAVAPHILVEDVTVEHIADARDAFAQGALRQGLAKYHADVDLAFHRWCDLWLSPAFRGWAIEDEIGAIRGPLLAVQGVDDEYGTLEQIHGIARRVPQTRTLELRHCGHSPHRDQPEALIEAAATFIRNHTDGDKP